MDSKIDQITLEKGRGGVMTNDELDKLVCQTRGDDPSIIWQAMNEEETGIYITFDNWMDAKSWQVDKFNLDPNAHKAHLVRREVWRNYSENIAAAWELVEEIVEREFEFDVRHAVGIFGYICTIETPGHHYPKLKYICISEDTAPRAICLAWLEWKKAQS